MAEISSDPCARLVGCAIRQFCVHGYIALRQALRELHIAAKTLLLRTDVGRWREVVAETPGWDDRNKLIAGLIPPGSSVLDLGAGAQSLKGYLAPGDDYQPCDLVKAAEGVLPCDFNAGWYPDIHQQYDFVVCSGLLEYVRDIRTFLRIVPTYGRVLIVSYACRQPSESKFARAKHGWLNHFTKTDLQAMFAAAGLNSTEVGVWRGQILFWLTSRLLSSSEVQEWESKVRETSSNTQPLAQRPP